MPEAIAQGEDGELYELCLRQLEDKGDARYGICANAYKEHHEKDPETGNWVRKKNHSRNDKGEWIVKQFAGFDDWIEIFRGGPQVDAAGVDHDGDQLIDRAVATFDPTRHEPPLVVGHPRHDAPAFGWVEKLRKGVKDGISVLYARFKDVAPELEHVVRNGFYRKRSAKFYPDGRLRHVGFLGAAVPAVQGMEDIRFSAEEKEMFFQFADREEAKEAQEARSKRYGIGIKEGGHVTRPGEWENITDDDFLDPVNYRYPCPDADQTRAAAVYWARERSQAQYTEEERRIIEKRLDEKRKKFKIGEHAGEKGGSFMNIKDFLKSLFTRAIDEIPEDQLSLEPPRTFTETEVKAREQEAAKKAREKADAEFAHREAEAKRRTEIAAWISQRVAEGKLLPAWADAGLAAFMEALDAGTPLEFAQGKDKQTSLQWFQSFLDSFAASPIFTEMATRGRAGQARTEAEQDQEVGKSIAAKIK